MEVLQRPAAGGQQRGSTWLRGGDGLLDELGLVAVAVGGDHGVAGDAGRDGGAVVAPHDVQAQVQAGGHAGAGQDGVVVDVEHACVDRDPGEAVGELRGGGPVGGGAAAVEQPG